MGAVGNPECCEFPNRRSMRFGWYFVLLVGRVQQEERWTRVILFIFWMGEAKRELCCVLLVATVPCFPSKFNH